MNGNWQFDGRDSGAQEAPITQTFPQLTEGRCHQGQGHQAPSPQRQPMGALINSVSGPVNVMVFGRAGNYSVGVNGTSPHEISPTQPYVDVGNGILQPASTHIQRTDGMAVSTSGSPTDETIQIGNWTNEQRCPAMSPLPSYTSDADEESSAVSSSVETLLAGSDMAHRSIQFISATHASETGSSLSSATEFSDSD